MTACGAPRKDLTQKDINKITFNMSVKKVKSQLGKPTKAEVDVKKIEKQLRKDVDYLQNLPETKQSLILKSMLTFYKGTPLSKVEGIMEKAEKKAKRAVMYEYEYQNSQHKTLKKRFYFLDNKVIYTNF